MKTVTWKSLKGVSYVLSINDGVSGTTALVPSATPFVTEVDNSEEFFYPVREQTGNIGIHGDVSTITGLLSSSPVDRPVTLTATKNDTSSIVWKGYLQTQAFSQQWDKGPIELSIPVVSHLGIIESYNLETIDYLSFADFINRMSRVTGTAFYSSFVFPAITNVLTVLKYRISARRFAKYDNNKDTWEYGTFREILEEVCKVFGWVAIEQGDVLCFIAPDSNAGYKKLTAAQLVTLAGDGSVTATSITQSAIVDSIFGNSHTIDYLPGKKSVNVIGDYDPLDMDIWNFSTGKMEKTATEDHTANIGGHDYLHFFSKSYRSNDAVKVDTNMSNLRLGNFEANNDNLYWGSCIACDREFVTNSDNQYQPLKRDSGWMEHIIYKVAYNQAPHDVAVITVPTPHIKTGMFADMDIIMKATIKESDNCKSEWETTSTIIKVKFEIGDNVMFDDFVQIKDSKIVTPSAWGMANATEGLAVYANSYSGQIKVTFSVPQSAVLQAFTYYYDKYYSLENITFSYSKPWTRHLEEAANENSVRMEIGGGWQDELSQTNMLSTMRPEQLGYGLILDDSLNPVTTLYNGTTPEEALATRMYSHFQTVKKMLTVQLAGNGEMLSPLHRHVPGSGDQMMCLSQSVDWRNEQITANLFEI